MKPYITRIFQGDTVVSIGNDKGIGVLPEDFWDRFISFTKGL